MPADPIVHIVDDDEAIRDSLSLLLRAASLNVMAFASPRQFIDSLEVRMPCCVLLDVRMPELSGLEVLRQLSKRHPPIPVIMMTAYGDIPMAVTSIKEGAVDLVEKPIESQTLLASVQHCLSQITPKRRRRTLRSEYARRMALLTARERAVLKLVVQGCLNKQIAELLDISVRTVEVHRSRVKKKLRANSVPEIVKIALSA
ncbi:MAG: response regulator [Mariprofundaceae bacterium]